MPQHSMPRGFESWLVSVSCRSLSLQEVPMLGVEMVGVNSALQFRAFFVWHIRTYDLLQAMALWSCEIRL